MMFEISTATDYADLLGKLNLFLTSTGSAFGLSYTGTGNGTLTAYKGGANSVAETFTITATSATDFTVTGSATGALSNATVGSAYSDSHVAFTLTAGGTAFVAGDTFLLNTAPPWTAMRSVTNAEYIWKAPGNDGLASIYVGAYAFSNAVAAYYNWRLLGATGFATGSAFTAQPGGNTATFLPLINSSIGYWFVADGRRVIVIAKVSSVYEVAYLGFLTPYATPGQFAYPLAVGGSMAWGAEPATTSTNWRWSYTGEEHSAFPLPLSGRTTAPTSGNICQLRIRTQAGAWQGFSPTVQTGWGYVWPSRAYCLSALNPDLDGKYPLFPLVAGATDSASVWQVFGELSGVAITTGYGAVAEDTFTVSPHDWLCVPNVYRSTRADYFAVKLD